MVCKVSDCPNKHKSRGYCSKHYMRFLVHGDATIALKSYHGKTYTPEFKAWINMKQRSTNPRHHAYKHYGGRGIKVCDRWLHSFDNFFEDMGERPENRTLDRIDNDGDYSPENCRWATKKEQINNRRVSNLVTYRDRTHTMGNWAYLLNVPLLTLSARILVYKWPVERAFEEELQCRPWNR